MLSWAGTVALSLASVIALVHFFGERFDEDDLVHERFWTSFSAGITVTYIFLVLLPELRGGVEIFRSYEFLFVLLGFSAVYTVKEFLYSYVNDIKSLRKDFQELHTAFLFSYYLCIGLLFYMIASSNVLNAYLLFVPVLLHTGFSSLAVKELHEDTLEMLPVRIAVSLSPLLGVFLAWLLPVSEHLMYSVLGAVSGMFFYIVLHDSLQPERDSPAGYIAGVMIYSSIMVVIWSLV